MHRLPNNSHPHNLKTEHLITQPLNYETYLAKKSWEFWEAACLIYQIEPNLGIHHIFFYSFMNDNWNEQDDPLSLIRARKLEKEISDNYPLSPRNKHSINPFVFINHTLQIKFTELPEELITAIQKETDTYNEIDKKLFKEEYPHISEKLKPSNENKINTKSLFKILLSIAIDKYKYKIGEDNQQATGSNNQSISAATERAGLRVTDDTVRKYIKMAEKLLKQELNNKT